MLPRVTITPDLSGRTLHSAKHFSKPASDHNRSSRKPVRAAFVPSSSSRQSATKVLTNATPTRRSFEKPPLEPGAPAPGIQSCLLDADSAGTSPDVEQQALSDAPISQHSSSTSTPSSSATSLHKSDSELALLLHGADLSRPGTTTVNIGSIPIQVPLAYIEVPSAECVEHNPAAVQEQQQQSPAASVLTAEPTAGQSTVAAAVECTPSKLKATSAEFYPPTYLAAAAAATALASASVASSSSSSELPGSPSAAAAVVDEEQQHAESLSAQQEEQQQEHYWQVVDPSEQQQQWQQQQQQWQQWQQPPLPMPVPMFFPVPVPIPPYLVPAYPYAYHQAIQHQQHMQVHPIMLHHHQQQQLTAAPPAAALAAEDSTPASPAAASVAGSSYTALSPDPNLPADTASLMSTPTAAAAQWALAHSSSLYGSSSSRPGSSASSVASGYTGMRSRQQQQALRDAGTVTVSALSSVKDAAGALAKVVSRHGSCLLLSLSRPGDQAALSTHVAAKSLAVARFYVNAHMAAAGAAGVDAAAVLTGLEPATPSAAAAAAGAVTAADDEVVFMPYNRTGSSRAATVAAVTDAEPALGFIVAKANAKDLPVVLPPPVGIPACMQDKQQQQHHHHDSSSAAAVASTSAAPAAAAAALLKAGANTDVNKLSNAIIHNILGSNHVALQLAGAAACHVAMKALIKARARLQRKFHADIVATASFANEDTSSSIGRSTVFLRLDVMRSSLLQQLSAVGSAVANAIEGSSAVPDGQQQYAPAV